MEIIDNRTDKQILEAAVKACISIAIDSLVNKYTEKMDSLDAFIQKARGEMEEIYRAVQPFIEHKMAQCPLCGEYALAGAFCEENEFICPSCSTKLVWSFNDKTSRYMLSHYPETKMEIPDVKQESKPSVEA